ncbi:MAG: hypothetical protein IJX25_04435 [Clostridia bacterium]|nr:hypothetical protein [Clostridia bacterium]
MLSHDFNINDLGFVKIWSQYQLTGDITPFEESLKHLALKGQPNAIAKWYEFFQPGKCSELDKYTSELQPLDFEELLAKGYFKKHFDENNMSKELAIYRNRVQTDLYFQKFEKSHSGNLQRESFHLRDRALREDVKNHTHLKYFRQSCRQAYKNLSVCSDTIQKELIRSRAYQIMLEYTYQLPKVGGLSRERTGKFDGVQKDLQSHLINQLKAYQFFAAKLKEYNLQISQYPQFAFSFASYINTYLKSTDTPSKKLEKLKDEIFTELSQLNVPFLAPEEVEKQ